MDGTRTGEVYARPFNTRAAATWLGMSERELLQRAREGEIPGRKVGRQWRFSQRALAEYACAEEDVRDGAWVVGSRTGSGPRGRR